MSSSGGVRRAGKQHQQRKRGRVLDGFFILRATGVDYPNELSTARLQHCALTETNTAQLAEFGNLAHLDVSGNALRFEDLQSLPRLEVLEMASSQSVVNTKQPKQAPEAPVLEQSPAAFQSPRHSWLLHFYFYADVRACNDVNPQSNLHFLRR